MANKWHTSNLGVAVGSNCGSETQNYFGEERAIVRKP